MQTEEKTAALELAIQTAEKRFGKGAVMRLGERVAHQVAAWPSGCLSLDMALGTGGYPRGRVVEIFGPEASGKTTLTLHAIAEVQGDVVGVVGFQAPARDVLERGADLHADHVTGQLRHQVGEVAAAGADLEHAVGGIQLQRLQQPRLHPGRHHHLAVADGHADVGVGEGAVVVGNEGVARRALHEVQHGLIQHLPGADLLLDHVESGLLDVHAGWRRRAECCACNPQE